MVTHTKVDGMKRAVIQCVDTGPLESLVYMLRAVGYECYLMSPQVRDRLRSYGCDTVYDVSAMMRQEGVEMPFKEAPLPLADISTFASCDLYVDVKAHRNGPKVWPHYPQLNRRTLWYRINGGEPTVVPGKGDEVNPLCPILTPNQWYGRQPYKSDRTYTCWPPFLRFNEYYDVNGRDPCEQPLCFVHNIIGWGFGGHTKGMCNLGVRIHGNGAPHNLVQHATIPSLLSKAAAYVHLKMNDAPGYALYEALAAACPILLSQRMLHKCLMDDVYVDGQTCLLYDFVDLAMVHHGHTDMEISRNCEQVAAHLERLKDPSENRRIGLAGHERLKELMWREDRDLGSLAEFMGRNFT